MTATFEANTYPDTAGVYLGISKNGSSFALFLTPEDVEHLKEVIENATR